MKCPKCALEMEKTYCSAGSSLSCVLPEQFDNFAFSDKDLSGSGLKKFLPHKAEFNPSHLCENCQVYVVEYGIRLSRKEVEESI